MKTVKKRGTVFFHKKGKTKDSFIGRFMIKCNYSEASPVIKINFSQANVFALEILCLRPNFRGVARMEEENEVDFMECKWFKSVFAEGIYGFF